MEETRGRKSLVSHKRKGVPREKRLCSSHITSKASNRLRTKPPIFPLSKDHSSHATLSSYPLGLLIPRKSQGTSRSPGSLTPVNYRDADQSGRRPCPGDCSTTSLTVSQG